MLYDRILSALTYAAGIEVDPGNVPAAKKGCSSGSSSSSSGVSSSSSSESISIGGKEHADTHSHSHDHDHVHDSDCSTSSSSSSSSSSSNSNSDSSSSSSSGSPISDNSSSSSSVSESSPTPTGSGTLYERLKVCPLHCVPLSQEVSGTGHMGGLNAQGGPRYRPPTPVVLGSPDSKVTYCEFCSMKLFLSLF